MVSEMPDGLSVQPPPPPGKLAAHVMWELNSYSIEHCTLLEEFHNKKNEYHFKVGAV